jgi:uncharacterized protein YbjT (DUF2867 family)
MHTQNAQAPNQYREASHSLRASTVLLCGARGFIGRRLEQALRAQGYQVRPSSRSAPLSMDFIQMKTPADWLLHLQGVDIVINAVGALRGTTSQPLRTLHTTAPIALFDACAQSGIRRVVQLSALGVDGNNTDYATTKRAADAHLLALQARGLVDALVVRPSIVWGLGGASTALFSALSQFPVLALPQPMQQALVQPLAVADLVDATVAMLQGGETGLVELGGPEALTMQALIACLRQQRGHRTAWVYPLPALFTRGLARLGDWVPASPWCSASLELASHDNCCNASTLRHWLDRPPLAPALFLSALQAR